MLSYFGQFSTILLSCLFMSIVIITQGATLDICQWIFCENGGTCQQVANSTRGYECRCQFGYNGTFCETRMNINTCGQNPCKNNGICSITNDHVIKCTCPQTYKGSLCEIKMK